MLTDSTKIVVDLGQPDERGLDAMIDWVADQIAAEVLAEAEAPRKEQYEY